MAFREPLLIQIVNFDESNSGGVVYTTHDRCVVTWLQVCYDRRLACCSRNMAAVLNIADLVTSDHTTEYRGLPVIIKANQCSGPIVQFQCRISQRVGDPMLRELGANRTDNHPLCPSALNNKTAN